jgi:hypothetical protein
MTTKTRPKELITIDELVKKHKGNVAAAARAAGVDDYIQFRRWFKRLVFAPAHSATRTLLAERGIELPHRPAKAKR